MHSQIGDRQVLFRKKKKKKSEIVLLRDEICTSKIIIDGYVRINNV